MKAWIKKQINNTQNTPDYSIDYYREKIFNIITFTFLVTGLLALIPGVIASIVHHLYNIAILDCLAYALLLFIFFKKNTKLILRKVLLLFIPLVLGVFFMYAIGPVGPGFAYLVGFNILAAILINFRATIYSLLITAGVLVLNTLIIHYQVFPDSLIHDYGSLPYFAAGINMILIGSVSALPLAFLVKSLENKLIQSEELQQQLKENIKELEVSKEKAEESNRLKSSFLSNMSHEVRTPLNSIMGFSELLRSQQGLSDRNKGLLQNIYTSGEYLLNVMENIMDISLIEAKQLRVSKYRVNINELMAKVEILFQGKAAINESVKLLFVLGENVPKSILSDEKRIQQVLINLVDNALKFTKVGEVEVCAHLENNNILFSVRDTGIGIPDEDYKMIFQRFVKSKTNHFENLEGTGLGLAISKEIVEKLGGKIWVISQYGKGSTFYFTIPCN